MFDNRSGIWTAAAPTPPSSDGTFYLTPDSGSSIGAGLIGAMSVGDDSLIAPGTVVNRSVETGTVFPGNPARPISRKCSFVLIEYPGMNTDQDRRAALARVADGVKL
jgi:hypothetical protein